MSVSELISDVLNTRGDDEATVPASARVLDPGPLNGPPQVDGTKIHFLFVSTTTCSEVNKLRLLSVTSHIHILHERQFLNDQPERSEYQIDL